MLYQFIIVGAFDVSIGFNSLSQSLTYSHIEFSYLYSWGEFLYCHHGVLKQDHLHDQLVVFSMYFSCVIQFSLSCEIIFHTISGSSSE